MHRYPNSTLLPQRLWWHNPDFSLSFISPWPQFHLTKRHPHSYTLILIWPQFHPYSSLENGFIRYKIPFGCFLGVCVLFNDDLRFWILNFLISGWYLRLFLALTYRLILIPHVKLMEESKWSNSLCLSGIFKSGMSAKWRKWPRWWNQASRAGAGASFSRYSRRTLMEPQKHLM